jgi:hypothetical protein
MYAIGDAVQTAPGSAYMNRTALALSSDAKAWTYASHVVTTPAVTVRVDLLCLLSATMLMVLTLQVPWVPGTRGSPKTTAWPPLGGTLAVSFKARQSWWS